MGKAGMLPSSGILVEPAGANPPLSGQILWTPSLVWVVSQACSCLVACRICVVSSTWMGSCIRLPWGWAAAVVARPGLISMKSCKDRCVICWCIVGGQGVRCTCCVGDSMAGWWAFMHVI